ncbi:hypothetical protein K523DRAFT_367106, partial [Schizophyllum commune Tattone D]
MSTSSLALFVDCRALVPECLKSFALRVVGASAKRRQVTRSTLLTVELTDGRLGDCHRHASPIDEEMPRSSITKRIDALRTATDAMGWTWGGIDDHRPPEACAGILGCRTRRQECLVEDFDQVLGVIECIYAACEPPEACAGFLGDLWRNSHQVLEVPQDLCPSYRGARQPLDTTPRHFGGDFSQPPSRRRHARGPYGEICDFEVLGVIESICATPKPPEACARPLGRRMRMLGGEIMPSRTPALPAPAASDKRGNSAALRGYAAGLRPDTTKSRRHVALPPPCASEERGSHAVRVDSPRVLAEGTRHVPLD